MLKLILFKFKLLIQKKFSRKANVAIQKSDLYSKCRFHLDNKILAPALLEQLNLEQHLKISQYKQYALPYSYCTLLAGRRAYDMSYISWLKLKSFIISYDIGCNYSFMQQLYFFQDKRSLCKFGVKANFINSNLYQI